MPRTSHNRLSPAPTLADYPPAAVRPSAPPVTDVARPLVSIVTVVYNGAQFLEHAIASVRQQEYRPLEYIVVDGGSTDGTLDILRSHAADIDCWISEPDDGIFDAMNKGIALSRGRLIKLLNADDLLTPGAVATAVAAHAGFGGPCVVTSDLEVIDQDGAMLKRMTGDRAINPFGGVLHPSWFVDRAIYERHGLYDPSLRTSADYELFVRLRTAEVAFVHCAQPLSQFRTGGNSAKLGGLKDRYLIHAHYLGRPTAVRLLAWQAYKKLRARALIGLVGERNLYRIRRQLERVLGRSV